MSHPSAPEHQTRTVVAGVVGNVLEWYDFSLFAYFAGTIGKLYFPKEDETAQLLNTFGIFALGFLMRPLGGVLFGHIGDRYGRKRALELSVLMMALPTTLMGLLPTHEHIGLWGALALTVIRMLQGLSVGGEFIGSMSFLGEHAPAGRRGYLSSWSMFSGGLGNLLGSAVAWLVTAVLTDEEVTAWGWRVPFLLGFGVGLAGLWLRLGIAESPRFRAAAAAGAVVRSPVLEVLQHHRRALLTVAGLSVMTSVGFYVPKVWMATWLAELNTPALSQPDALAVTTIALAVGTALTPLFGALSDRWGRKPLLAVGAGGYALLAYPFFAVSARGTFAAALAAQLVYTLFFSAFVGPVSAAFAELFPTRTRYSGIAVGYNGTLAALGGTSPLIATWLIHVSGNNLAPAYFLMASSTAALLVVLTVPERSREPLD